jgi:hypothetical protein
MPAHRRPLLLSVATAALVCPACIVFPTQTTSETHEKTVAVGNPRRVETARRDVFGELPSRPGDVVAIKASPKPENSAASQANTNTVCVAPPSEVKPIAVPPGSLPSVVTGPAQPASKDSPLLKAVQAYADGRPNDAIDILKSLDGANQEFVLAVMPILARGATADLASDPSAVAMLVDQLETAAARLEARAALRIENMAFCGKVSGFGRYDLWPEGQPYRPNDQAQLYLEVRNLLSVPTTGPHGETHLTHARVAVEIKDAHGVLVKQPDPEDWRRRVDVARFEKKLFSRGPVHDFHVLYAFPVPTNPGVYTATVEVRDPNNRRVRSAPKEFRVTGP